MDRTTLLLRLALAALVGLSLMGLRLPGGARIREPVLVVDVSRSVGAAARIAAGEEAWLAVGEGLRWLAPAARPEGLSREASRLGAALAEVTATHPGRAVLLVSDGRATDDALGAAHALAAAGGRLFTRASEPPCADVGLVQAQAQRVGTTVRVRARWAASIPGAVRLLLRREGRVVAQVQARLDLAGQQEALLEEPDAPVEAAAYRLEILPLAGTPNDDPGNDALALGVPPDRPAVLVWGALDLEALRRSAPSVSVRAHADPGPGELAAADLVLLAGVAAADVRAEAVSALRAFVAAGGTLLVLGGPSAYGAGGWEGSALERELLALRVRRGPEQGADVVLALDVSGSTSGEPLRALVAAACEALRALQPGERLAVLPFRAHAALAPLTGGFAAAGESAARESLEVALAGLVPGGPTDLVGGIAAAAHLLSATPAGRERILLLLTDGDPHEAPDEAGLASVGAALRAAGVGFGALVVDMPQAVQALRRHVAVRAQDVQALDAPRGLAAALLEQLGRRRAAREQRRAGEPEAVEAAPGSWADLLPQGWKPAWVHDVEPADGARVLARARWSAGGGGEVALAAERTLGAGRSAALAWGPGAEIDPSDAVGRLGPLVARLASEVGRGRHADLDAWGRVVVRLPQAAGRGRVRLVAGSGMHELLEVEPGLFRSLGAPTLEPDLRVRGEGFEERLRLPVLPPLEHRGVGPDLERLAALARAGGGRLLTADEQPPAVPRGPGAPLAPWLLLGACMLLVVERRRA